jgi:hypothetical protein
VAPAILNVRLAGVPAEVLQAVVRRVAVVVAAFPTLGTGTGERLQDEAVHVAAVLLPAVDQADGEVAAVLRGGLEGAPDVRDPGEGATTAPAGFDDTIAPDPGASEALDRSAGSVHGLM